MPGFYWQQFLQAAVKVALQAPGLAVGGGCVFSFYNVNKICFIVRTQESQI